MTSDSDADRPASSLQELVGVDDSGGAHVGIPRPGWGRRTFGGHTLAHMMMTAVAETARLPSAVRATFVSPGTAGVATRYRSWHLRSGRSADLTRVTAEQDDRLVADAIVELRDARSEPEWRRGMPAVPPPVSCLPLPRARTEQARRIRAPFDLRAASALIDGEVGVWIRSLLPHGEGASPAVSAAALAYASDFLITAPVHGVRPDRARLASSLDHVMWFHEQPPPESWLLVQSRCVAINAGRSLCEAQVFTEAGAHIASATQTAFLQPLLTARTPAASAS